MAYPWEATVDSVAKTASPAGFEVIMVERAPRMPALITPIIGISRFLFLMRFSTAVWPKDE